MSNYPPANPTADGSFPTWDEYMASLPADFRVYPQTCTTVSYPRGAFDDSIPEYYESGPIYENDEDGWQGVRRRVRRNRNEEGEEDVRQRRTVRGSTRAQKALKKQKEQERQQQFFANNTSFSANAASLNSIQHV